MYRTLMLSSLWLMVSFTVINAQTFQEVVESGDKNVWYAYLANHDLNACNGNQSLLSAAAQKGNIPLIKVLLKEGAQVDQSCSGGDTPLMLATAFQRNHAASKGYWIAKALYEIYWQQARRARCQYISYNARAIQ